MDTSAEPAGRKTAHGVAWVSNALMNCRVRPMTIDFQDITRDKQLTTTLWCRFPALNAQLQGALSPAFSQPMI